MTTHLAELARAEELVVQHPRDPHVQRLIRELHGRAPRHRVVARQVVGVGHRLVLAPVVVGGRVGVRVAVVGIRVRVGLACVRARLACVGVRVRFARVAVWVLPG